MSWKDDVDEIAERRRLAKELGGARRIAILAPMPSELQPLMGPLGLVRSPDSEFFRGKIGRVEVVAARTGIGMDAGTSTAQQVLEAAAPDHLIVVGIAGGIGASVAFGDLVVPDRVLNLDTGLRSRPAPLGDQPARGILASSDRLLETREEAAGSRNRESWRSIW